MGWAPRMANTGEIQGMDLQPYCLTKIDAENILGQTAALTDSMSRNKGSISIFQCTYTANDKDADTGKLGAVYFMVEHYNNPSSAKEKYQSFKISNQNSPGFQLFGDIGDEAWFLTDEENFCLLVVRKNDKMLRLKVNKLTSKTSVKTFHEVARKITDEL